MRAHLIGFVVLGLAGACGGSPANAPSAPARPTVTIVDEAVAPARPPEPPPPVGVEASTPEQDAQPVGVVALDDDARALGERRAWKERLKWTDECDGGFMPSAGDVGVEETDLGGSKSLVRVLCERGAYNLGAAWFWIERTAVSERVTALPFPTYEVPTETTTRASVSPILRGLDELDVKKREITVWRKFRGIGDCGLSARYAVDGGKVRVLDIRAKLACDGQPAEGAAMRRLPVPRVK